MRKIILWQIAAIYVGCLFHGHGRPYGGSGGGLIYWGIDNVKARLSVIQCASLRG